MEWLQGAVIGAIVGGIAGGLSLLVLLAVRLTRTKLTEPRLQVTGSLSRKGQFANCRRVFPLSRH
jgi:hypothetical protein